MWLCGMVKISWNNGEKKERGRPKKGNHGGLGSGRTRDYTNITSIFTPSILTSHFDPEKVRLFSVSIFHSCIKFSIFTLISFDKRIFLIWCFRSHFALNTPWDIFLVCLVFQLFKKTLFHLRVGGTVLTLGQRFH